MTPDPDQHLNPLEGLHQVESLASISDRVLRKKDQQQKKDQHHGHEKKKIVRNCLRGRGYKVLN